MARLTSGRTAIALAVALTFTACGGGDDDADGDGVVSPPTPLAEAASTPAASSATAIDDDDVDDVDDSVPAEECNDLSPADISTAAGGAPFDTVNDVSIDTERSCLFTAQTQIYGVTVSIEATETFLAGDLVGLGSTEMNSMLEQLHTMTLSESQAVPLTVAGSEGVLLTGPAMTGGATASAAIVVDGEVVQVTADGEALGDLAAVTTAVLEAALSA